MGKCLVLSDGLLLLLPKTCPSSDHRWRGTCPAWWALVVSLDWERDWWCACSWDEGKRCAAMSSCRSTNNCKDSAHTSCRVARSLWAEMEWEISILGTMAKGHTKRHSQLPHCSGCTWPHVAPVLWLCQSYFDTRDRWPLVHHLCRCSDTAVAAHQDQ